MDFHADDHLPVAGGTPDVGAGRALVTVAIYVTIAAFVASVVFARRDVTA